MLQQIATYDWRRYSKGVGVLIKGIAYRCTICKQITLTKEHTCPQTHSTGNNTQQRNENDKA